VEPLATLKRVHMIIAIVANSMLIMVLGVGIYLAVSASSALHDQLGTTPSTTHETFTGCDPSYVDCPTN
jgi:hypothetical protein